MTTKVEEIDGKLVATLVGELDTAAAAETEKALMPLLNSEGKDIIIDVVEQYLYFFSIILAYFQ